MFVQIIEFRTDRYDDVLELARRWSADATGSGTASAAWVCTDRDHSGVWRWIVQFPSYDAAMENSRRSETDALSHEFAALCDGEPIFRNLDVAHSQP